MVAINIVTTNHTILNFLVSLMGKLMHISLHERKGYFQGMSQSVRKLLSQNISSHIPTKENFIRKDAKFESDGCQSSFRSS
jgi:hypothetical protein